MIIGTGLPSSVSTVAPIDSEYFVSEFEDVGRFPSPCKTSNVPESQRGHASAGSNRAQVGPLIDFNIALDVDPAKVVVVFVPPP